MSTTCAISNARRSISRSYYSFGSMSYQQISSDDKDSPYTESSRRSAKFIASGEKKESNTLTTVAEVLKNISVLLIMWIVNLFFAVSFGLSIFPTQWVFPSNISRSIGVQMFFLSTSIIQFVLTHTSEFQPVHGMAMVENIPFWHVICKAAVEKQGMGVEAFATVFVTMGLSSVLVGLCFYALGKFEVGNAVYFVPKYVITGCIGGIGIFIFTTGIEASTNLTWDFNYEKAVQFTTADKFPKWLAALLLDLFLRFSQYIHYLPLLPSFYFISIPPMFYIVLFLSRIPVEVAHENGWFFEKSENPGPFAIFELIRFDLVDWSVVGTCLPTILALTLFSLMHAPINIPSLSLSTSRNVDMNNELRAHGIANMVAGLFGGLQNYLCYSNSVLYFQCSGSTGTSPILGYLLSAISIGMLFFGSTTAYYIPRCLGGCLLMHVGIELVKEAIWDAIGELDNYEYASVIALTVVMTFYGMTAGLVLGVVCAALTFTAQASKQKPSIRGIMSAATLRSLRWRTASTISTIEKYARDVRVVQLQGYLFFGNAISIASTLEKMLIENRNIRILVLDFTLVVGLDSSAVAAVTNLAETCQNKNVRVCFALSSDSLFRLPEKHFKVALFKKLKKSNSILAQLQKITKKSPGSRRRAQSIDETGSTTVIPFHTADESMSLFYVAFSLDDALSWCEDQLVNDTVPGQLDFEEKYFSSWPAHMWQLYALCPRDTEPALVERLMTYFKLEVLHAGQVLWHQGEASDKAVLVVSGQLLHSIEEEAGTTEEIGVGHLVGELGLITLQRRHGTLQAIKESVVHSLSKAAWDTMTVQDPQLALLLSRICLGYLGRRAMHVSNRIWESRCIPV